VRFAELFYVIDDKTRSLRLQYDLGLYTARGGWLSAA